MPTIEKYGLKWPDTTLALEIELAMIRSGGKKTIGANTGGEGLYFHTKAAMDLIWPEDDWHRWAELALKSILENEVVVFLGCGDSGKTWMMAKWAMLDWWVDPDITMTLVSSTETRGAELRIWGNIKEFFNRGRERFPWLPGKVLESIHTITLQEIDPEADVARVLKSGLQLVPCMAGGKYVGLGKFIGMKAPKDPSNKKRQGKLRHVGDEVAAMQVSFLDAYDNWYGKENFKGLMAANPLDPEGPEGIASQPLDGWSTFVDTGKTQTWTSKFYNAYVVNFDGRDSPNFDFPDSQPAQYPYLPKRSKIEAVIRTHGKDSWHFYWQCCGKMKPGMMLNRVLTREICKLHKSDALAVWFGEARTSILSLDPSYGGGDRCVLMQLDFGQDINNQSIIKFYPPELVPINVSLELPVDDQIAAYVKARATDLGVPATNIFWDSFGKGTLGYAFAKIFGASTPVPVDSGARPTKRPVRFDLYVMDAATRDRRHKRCDEHYSKFVTEMWFSVAEVVRSEQCRELPEEVMAEFCLREYTIVAGDKIEVESKVDLKERVGKSPDLADCAAVGVEGARRLGFQIKRIGSNDEDDTENDGWLSDMADRQLNLVKSKQLSYR